MHCRGLIRLMATAAGTVVPLFLFGPEESGGPREESDASEAHRDGQCVGPPERLMQENA